MITMYELAVTTNAWGGGTATSVNLPRCEVVSVRMANAGTTITASGTADFTITRVVDGGTILALTDANAPWQYQPSQPAHSVTGGTTAYSLGVGPVYDDGIPLDGQLKVVVAQGGTAGSGSIYFYLES